MQSSNQRAKHLEEQAASREKQLQSAAVQLAEERRSRAAEGEAVKGNLEEIRKEMKRQKAWDFMP